MKRPICLAVLISFSQLALGQQSPVQQPPPLKPGVFVGHSHAVSAVEFAPNGKILATGSFDFSLKLWDVATSRELRTLAGHQHQVLTLNISRDGTMLASGSRDNTVRLWDMIVPDPVAMLAGHAGAVQVVDLNADGSLIASA